MLSRLRNEIGSGSGFYLTFVYCMLLYAKIEKEEKMKQCR
jgi:hypothetical protein